MELTSRWSRVGSTTFFAPLSAGPSKLTWVGLPLAPIHTPSGCANLSLLSERIVSHFTPGVTSSPFGPFGAFNATRNGLRPLNSLFGRNVLSAHTPWLGVPPSTAIDTLVEPSRFCT